MKKVILMSMAFPVAVWGATFNFPGSGGDLAGNGPDGWNGTPPGAEDVVALRNAGVYTLSRDITFRQLYTGADGIVLRLGERKLTTTSSIYGTVANATITYDGGTFNLSGTGNFSPVQADVRGATAIVTNGCVVTNVSTFNVTSYSSQSRTVVTGGSRIYASSGNLSHQGGTGNSLELANGAHVYIDQSFSWGGSGGTATAYGGSRLAVSGAGSLFHQHGGTQSNPYYMVLGNRFADDVFMVTDGASVVSDFGGVKLGAKGGCELTVKDGATATLPLFYFTGSGNQATISNAAFTNATAFSMAHTDNEMLHNPGGHSNNVFLATGPNASVSLRGPDFFGTGHHNVIRVEDGAQLQQSTSLSEFMSQTCNSKLLISGSGTSVGKTYGTFYVAQQSSAGAVNSVSNIISVADGATFFVGRMYLMGIGNELSISNGTVEITGDSILGFTVGAGSAGTLHTNNVVTLCGETPKLKILTDYMPFRLRGDSTLRFRVPKEGYAREFIPIDLACDFEMESSSALELDCEEWAARTGGKLHLIKSKALRDSADPAGTTLARLNATVLPPDCKLIVSAGNVYLKCPRRKGMVVCFR